MTASRPPDSSESAGLPTAPLAAAPGFAGLLGQPAVVQALQTAIGQQRLPHALLFTGPAGVGKATCAGILAQAVNCLALGPGDSCGSCAHCSKLARGLHPDMLWVTAERSSIPIRAITPRDGGPSADRTVCGFVAYAPYEARRRVVVIDGAHGMNAAAQNALLKTLEEPPRSSLLILTTEAPASLLPTIRSRCQSLRFSPVAQQLVREHLQSTLGCDADEARLRAALAPGSIGRALALDLDAYEELVSAVVEALRMAVKGGGAVIEAADRLSGLGAGETATARARDVLHAARDVLRDLLHVSSGADHDALMNPSHLDAWSAWAQDLDADRATAAMAAVARGIDYVGGPIPPNIKLALEKTLFEVGGALAGSRADQRPGL